MLEFTLKIPFSKKSPDKKMLKLKPLMKLITLSRCPMKSTNMTMRNWLEKLPLEREILNTNNLRTQIWERDSNSFKDDSSKWDRNSLLMKSQKILDSEPNYKNSKPDSEMPTNKKLDWLERVWLEDRSSKLLSRKTKESNNSRDNSETSLKRTICSVLRSPTRENPLESPWEDPLLLEIDKLFILV